jgi:hypothetical protein
MCAPHSMVETRINISKSLPILTRKYKNSQLRERTSFDPFRICYLFIHRTPLLPHQGKNQRRESIINISILPVFFLLGDSPASEFYMQTFRNTVSCSFIDGVSLHRLWSWNWKNIQNTAKLWNHESEHFLQTFPFTCTETLAEMINSTEQRTFSAHNNSSASQTFPAFYEAGCLLLRPQHPVALNRAQPN